MRWLRLACFAALMRCLPTRHLQTKATAAKMSSRLVPTLIPTKSGVKSSSHCSLEAESFFFPAGHGEQPVGAGS
eukprot:876241-Pleurochrysis_carterae.AAC.1